MRATTTREMRRAGPAAETAAEAAASPSRRRRRSAGRRGMSRTGSFEQRVAGKRREAVGAVICKELGTGAADQNFSRAPARSPCRSSAGNRRTDCAPRAPLPQGVRAEDRRTTKAIQQQQGRAVDHPGEVPISVMARLNADDLLRQTLRPSGKMRVERVKATTRTTVISRSRRSVKALGSFCSFPSPYGCEGSAGKIKTHVNASTPARPEVRFRLFGRERMRSRQAERLLNSARIASPISAVPTFRQPSAMIVAGADALIEHVGDRLLQAVGFLHEV